ncbi:uncharacterized protein MONBRDRAFT_24758 [Monosiga brevicollis MX1]|uniref:Protein kinase domain-containing protein n=1 Tax=Monosiga brevicollis TaxID=81824 RepID=A9UXE0_MONBE|nr:uncharacterized protein MONBRDRAFT_24758 [Monosiga brevicollis MX1]EDQ90374.1 predicted protein [Monosiga brevicollis MX1]|eukprot:XP_001745141.1 hypothetical protein [Monosiga brevicollis MX1]
MGARVRSLPCLTLLLLQPLVLHLLLVGWQLPRVAGNCPARPPRFDNQECGTTAVACVVQCDVSDALLNLTCSTSGTSVDGAWSGTCASLIPSCEAGATVGDRSWSYACSSLPAIPMGLPADSTALRLAFDAPASGPLHLSRLAALDQLQVLHLHNYELASSASLPAMPGLWEMHQASATAARLLYPQAPLLKTYRVRAVSVEAGLELSRIAQAYANLTFLRFTEMTGQNLVWSAPAPVLSNLRDMYLLLNDCQQLDGLNVSFPALRHLELTCRYGTTELKKSLLPQSSQLRYLQLHIQQGATTGAGELALTSITYDAWWRIMNFEKLQPNETALAVVTPDIQCYGREHGDGLVMINCSCYNPPYQDAPFCPKPAQNVVCPSSGSALEIVQICDGVADCPNGEDEASCHGLLKLRSMSRELPYFQELDCIDQVELWVERGVIRSSKPSESGNYSCSSLRGVMRNWDAAELHYSLSSIRALVTERPKPWLVLAVTLRFSNILSEEVLFRLGYQLMEGSLFGLIGSNETFSEDFTLPSLSEFEAQYHAHVNIAASTTRLPALTPKALESSTGVSSVVVVVAVVASITFVAAVAVVAYMGLRRSHSRKEQAAMESEILTLMREARADFDSAYPHLHLTPLELLDPDAIKVEHAVGHGNFSDVYQASLLRGEQAPWCVAIKKCHADKTTLLAWLREIMLLHSFRDQPNIIGLHGVLLSVAKLSNLSAVLEWAPHGNLRDFVRRHPLSEAQLHQALHQTVSALAYLAKLDIVHRDVAARNVLVMAASPTFVCKLGDFGLSRIMPSSEYYKSTADSEMPFRWMALECLVARRYSEHSDVWAFGVLVWELVTAGATPWQGMELPAIIQQLKAGAALPLPPGAPSIAQRFALPLRFR